MRNHNRNSERRTERNLNRMNMVNAVKFLVSELYFKNVKDKTDYTNENIDKIATLLVRELGTDISLSGDKKKDAYYVYENYIDQDVLNRIAFEYSSARISNKYDSRAIVGCVNLKNLIENVFDIELDDEKCGLKFTYDVYCSCGAKTIYSDNARTFGYDTPVVEDYENIMRSNAKKMDKYGSWTCGQYKCPVCGNVCFTHMGTNTPYGVPADSKTRKLRNEIHCLIEERYRDGAGKHALYLEMARAFDIPVEDMHIGLLSYEECLEIKEWLLSKESVV